MLDPPDLGWKSSWWAEDLALADGDPVSTWTDRISGATRQFQSSGSARPTFVAASEYACNNQAVRFDGVDDYMAVAATLNNPAGDLWRHGQWTMVFVFSYNATGFNASFSYDTPLGADAGPDRVLWSSGTGTVHYAHGSYVSGGTIDSGVAGAAGEQHLVVIRKAASSPMYKFTFDDTTAGPTALDNQAVELLEIGRSQPTSGVMSYLAGDVVFVGAVASRQISDAEVTQLWDWVEPNYRLCSAASSGWSLGCVPLV